MEALGGGGETSGPPQRITKVELIQRIAAVAFQRFPEVVDRGWNDIGAGLGRGQIVVHLAERHHPRYGLERRFGARKISSVIAAQAQEKTGLVIMDVAGRYLLEPLGGRTIFFPAPEQAAELKIGQRIVSIQVSGLGEEGMLVV